MVRKTSSRKTPSLSVVEEVLHLLNAGSPEKTESAEEVVPSVPVLVIREIESPSSGVEFGVLVWSNLEFRSWGSSRVVVWLFIARGGLLGEGR